MYVIHTKQSCNKVTMCGFSYRWLSMGGYVQIFDRRVVSVVIDCKQLHIRFRRQGQRRAEIGRRMNSVGRRFAGGSRWFRSRPCNTRCSRIADQDFGSKYLRLLTHCGAVCRIPIWIVGAPPTNSLNSVVTFSAGFDDTFVGNAYCLAKQFQAGADAEDKKRHL